MMYLKRVPPSGPIDARLIVLGEAPGTQEIEKGVPFVGPSGAMLDQGLQGNRAKVRVLNVRDWKVWDKQPRRERLAEIAERMEAIQHELHTYREARTLLCVGADALRAVLGTDSISKYHGSFLTRAEAGAFRSLPPSKDVPTPLVLPPNIHTIGCTFHPAFALRGNPQFKGEILVAIGRAWQASQASSSPCVRPEAASIALGGDYEEVARAIGKWDRYCIDIETSRDGSRIDLFGWGFPDGTQVSASWGSDVLELAKSSLRAGKVVIGHNLLFDLRRLYEAGCRLDATFVDTIAGAALLHPPPTQSAKKEGKVSVGPSRLSLGACAVRYVPFAVNWKQPSDPYTQALYRASWSSVPQWQWPMLYNSLDCHYNLKMWWPMRELLQRGRML
jgi:uracil-DNA glycosylase family 4